MKNHHWIIYLLVGVIVLIICSGVFSLGDKHGVESMAFRQVSPTELAEAMKYDHFYRSYRENTLLVSGVIVTLTQQGNELILGFKTSSTYQTLCDLGNVST
jgi:hypothetical protein